MFSREELEAVVRPLIEERGCELVEAQVVPGGRQLLLRVFVDQVGGFGIADCAELSRAIVRRLDLQPSLVTAYRLEVSSAGMNRPIWTLEHFRRFQGELVKGEFVHSLAGRTRFAGRIATVEGERIRLELAEGEQLEVPIEEIASARLELDPWKGRHQVRPTQKAKSSGERER